MSFGQSGCNVVKGGDFSGNASGWTLKGDASGWYYSPWALNEIYIDADGVVDEPLSQNITALFGNTLTVSFNIKGQNANRTACNTTATLKVRIGGTLYMTINNPANNNNITTANITPSNGAVLTSTAGFPISSIGTLGQGTIVFTIPWSSGTAANLEFLATTSNTPAGSGLCLTTSGGDDWILDNISVIASDPTDFVMTGSNGCAGTNTAMGLNNSQVGVSYQLQRDGVNVGSIVAGTGAAISLGTQSVAGTYKVMAIVGSANCKTMTGSVVINSVPTVSNAGPDQTSAATCGLTSVTLAGNNPTSGTGIWSIFSGAGGTVTTPTSPTSTFTGIVGTSYTLRWTISNSPCTASTDDVVIRINQSPTVSITGNNYICAGSTTTLSPTTGGTWTSSNDLVATVNNAGLVTGVATGSATFTFTSSVAPGCTATTPAVTVSTGLSTIYNASGSFTVPAGVTSLQVECWGGGGAGGGSSATNVKGGGGGAGGAYIMGTIPVSAGSYTVTVGAVRPGTAAAGAQGNPSWFGSTSTIYAEGGAGGSAPNNTTVSGGTGSSASTITNGTLITKSPGSNGANGTTTIGGAGGNGANTTSPEGLGGAQRTTNENDGNAGVAPGGGGGGAFLTDGTDHIGGAGGAGRVRITIASPTASAGGSQTICQTGTATVSGASAANGAILWTHNGAGSLSNATTLTPTYTAATGDAGNTVTLTMTVSNGPCVTPATATYTVTVRPTITASISGTTSVCQGGSTPNVTFTNPLSEAITVTYNINGGTSGTVNVGANTTATVAAPTGTSGTFVYNLVSAVYQAAPTCSASLTGSATVTVRPTVIASISGTTSVCQGGSTPNVTFTNSLSEAITVTYNINGGTSATVNVGANATATVAVPTGTSGTFVYNLVSAVYQAAPTCSASLTGSATVTVRPTVTASISGTTSVCQGGSTPNVTFTNSLSEAITVTYNINGGTSATVNVGANTTATVAVPTGTSGTFVYNLVSAVYQAAPTCSASLTGSATVTVRPTVTASISGTTSVCQGGSTPNVTFTNPLNEAITVTYNINGGTSATVNVGANTTAILAAPTGTSGTFVYNLVSAVYQTTPTCSAPLTGSATITVRPTVTASISGTTSVCQGGSTPNVTFTNPLSEAITLTYNINGGTSTTVNVGANTTATVAVSTGTSGTFVYNLVSAVYQVAPTCSEPLTGSATITVRPTVTASISGTTSVCQGGSTPNVTFTNPLNEAITVTYNINGGTSATVNVGANTTAILAAPTGTSGTFVYNLVSAVYQTAPTCSAPLTGSCTVTIQPTPSTPTVGATTNISCTTNTGSVILSDLPSSGSWTITSTPATVITTGSGTSTTISGLAIGSYTFTVTNDGGCPSAASSTVDIFDHTSTTWNGSGWSNGVPNASKNIIIDSVTPNSPFTADLQGCALTINNGVIATVPSGVTLTITNAVTTNGQLIFENNASLVQINNVANSGSIVYKRISYPMKNFDATYWSSPVAGQTLVDLSPNTLSDKYIGYNNSVWKTEARTNVMKPGIGYAIRVPKPNYWPIPTATTYAQPVEFKGVPNNGNITSSQAVTAGKYYLIGNPYPSALDAREFLYSNANNNAVLNGTIYFWTHNTGISPSGGKYVYSSNDYASFNATGGTATTGANNAIPSGYIAAGQSFMASAKANGTVQFDNSMRVGGADNAQFFKPGKSSKSTGFESHRLWLNMTNSGGAFKQTLIGYVEGATNSYDDNFDGETFDGNTYIDFYSVNTTNKLTIQGRALPFTNTDLVPLGYRSTIAGDFTISIDKADGNLASQRVYLEDKQTGTINELTAGNYVFTTKAGTFNDRFVLRYSANTLGTGDFEVADDAVWVKIANKTVNVNSTSENIDKVFIYDISGKQLYVKKDVNNLQLLIENLPSAQQVLLVKVILDNGYQTTKKVVFN
ncbi:T9SS sorting signal type C domain-containing protein [Flavobacterium sp. LM4]|uniref:T9SS sorting signal type C domain-containing protein n=1 Tax=Flavobacterium sp. LM4 TaxID=1938609 RepID=UPI0016703898|nr:T9SS sorting signal type C domain-containing protein [Flavobacterium sp. LM4]